jgi:erythromycin esterase
MSRAFTLVLAFGLVLPATAGSEAPAAPAAAVPPEHLIPLNLDFSRPGAADPAQPWGWFLGSMTGSGVAVEVAERTLRLRRDEEGPAARAYYPLPGILEPGREVAITAKVSRPAGSKASVRLGLSVYDEAEEVGAGWSPWACGSPDEDASTEAESGTGTDADAGATCRSELRAELAVPADALSGQLILEQSGSGEVTVSPIRLLLDGSAIETGVVPGQHPPSEAEVAWVRRNAVPLASVEPSGSLDDLQALDPLIGDARFVLLGESTHGSHELFTLKHRIVRWLAEERGFGVFALEDHVGAADRIDRYVQAGEGDPAEAVRELFAVWERQEMLDLVRWMRSAVAAGEARIHFRGVDLQYPLDAIRGLAEFAAEHDPELADAVESGLGPMRAAWEEGWYPSREPAEHEAWVEAARRIVERMEQSAPAHRESAGTAAAERAAFDARLVLQSAELSLQGSSALRDRYMAENLSWIADHEPAGTRIVVWAHNAHVSRAHGSLGRELAEQHPGEVLSVALLTAVGEYSAYVPGREVTTFPLFPAPPDSVEYLLDRAGPPVFALDLRQVRGSDEPGSRRLRTRSLVRSIGAFPVDFGFYPGELATAFDVLLFVDETSASRGMENADR